MEIHELEILIENDGRVRLHVQGVAGPACLELTRTLEAALGEVIERQMTAEAFDTSPEEFAASSQAATLKRQGL